MQFSAFVCCAAFCITGAPQSAPRVSILWSRRVFHVYDAFGEAFAWELVEPDWIIARPATDLLYAGEQWDADLGMQYLRARYYLLVLRIFNCLDIFALLAR